MINTWQKEWDGFTEGRWSHTSVNVRDFIKKNYTPYEGDESFLAPPTDATKKLWDKVMDLSLRDYCDRQIEESKASGDQKTVDFCKATLTYGAAAQELFGYKTNDLATKTYVSPINDVVVPDDFAAKTPETSAGTKRLTQALSLDSRVAINTYIEPADGVSADDLVLTVDGVAVLPKKTVTSDATSAKITRKTLNDGRILLQISGIAPRDAHTTGF